MYWLRLDTCLFSNGYQVLGFSVCKSKCSISLFCHHSTLLPTCDNYDTFFSISQNIVSQYTEVVLSWSHKSNNEFHMTGCCFHITASVVMKDLVLYHRRSWWWRGRLRENKHIALPYYIYKYIVVRLPSMWQWLHQLWQRLLNQVLHQGLLSKQKEHKKWT